MSRRKIKHKTKNYAELQHLSVEGEERSEACKEISKDITAVLIKHSVEEDGFNVSMEKSMAALSFSLGSLIATAVKSGNYEADELIRTFTSHLNYQTNAFLMHDETSGIVTATH